MNAIAVYQETLIAQNTISKAILRASSPVSRAIMTDRAGATRIAHAIASISEIIDRNTSLIFELSPRLAASSSCDLKKAR